MIDNLDTDLDSDLVPFNLIWHGKVDTPAKLTTFRRFARSTRNYMNFMYLNPSIMIQLSPAQGDFLLRLIQRT